MGDREAGGAIATEKDKVRWTNQWTMEHVTIEGNAAVHFIEVGKGIYSPFTKEVGWRTESWWSYEDAFRPLRFDKTFTDAEGKPLIRELEAFDWKKHQARFERRDLQTGKSKTETIEVPDDTLSVEGIAAALRAVPFAEGTKVSAHLLSNEPKLYDVTLEIRGRESCMTRQGSEECYKLELVPHLGLLNVFRFAFPRTYFWFSTRSSHEWIRYEGLEAGRGTPEIVMKAR